MGRSHPFPALARARRKRKLQPASTSSCAAHRLMVFFRRAAEFNIEATSIEASIALVATRNRLGCAIFISGLRAHPTREPIRRARRRRRPLRDPRPATAATAVGPFLTARRRRSARRDRLAR